MKVGIALLKILHILTKYLSGELPILRHSRHIIFIPNLDDDLIEWLFLFSGEDPFIIIINPTVSSFLFRIVSFQCSIEQGMVYLFYRFVGVSDVLRSALYTLGLPCTTTSRHCSRWMI